MVGAALVLLAAFSLSGCVGSAVENSFRDADERYTNSFNGGHQQMHSFNVPPGTTQVRVALHYDVAGGFNAQLMGSMGVLANVNEGGANSQKNDNWYSSSSPTPGQWQIQVNAGGSGGYAFGVYLD
jgi:hypothetical protein